MQKKCTDAKRKNLPNEQSLPKTVNADLCPHLSPSSPLFGRNSQCYLNELNFSRIIM